MRDWTRTSTRQTLLALLGTLPERPITLRASTTWEPTADDVSALVGRRVAIA